MKIGIEISTLVNHGHDIGAGRYTFNLVESLLSIGSQDEYVLVARALNDKHIHKISSWEKYKAKIKLFKTSQKKLNAWDRLSFPPYELLGFRADVFHCPDFMIPPAFNSNIVLTIHDLAFVRFPEFNFDWFIKKYTKQVKANARRAKKIIAVSRSTKNDIVNFFGIPAAKISVIYQAADSIFQKMDKPDSSVLDRYDIGREYILSVGTVEPRKNYPLLINAFAKIKPDHPKLKLAIVGRTGWKSEPSYKAREDNPYKQDILFLGKLDDHDLAHLYNQAKAFVYPSLFEGFGLPVLEAMSCGSAVIAAHTSSIPEVVGQGGMLIPPNNSQDLSAAIHKVLSDTHFRQELSKKALLQAKKFSWADNARQSLELYRSI